MTYKEYAVLALGISVLGSFFGTALFYYIPDFWDPAPVWGIPISFVAALLTCLPVILFSRSHSALNRLGFCGSLLVVGYCLVMLIQDSSHVSSGILPAGLLNNIQITSSWAYPLYVLIPASLTVITSWAVGQLMLALIHRFSGRTNERAFRLNAKFLAASLVTASLTIFTLGCFTLISSGPIYISLSFDHSAPEALREQTIQRVMADQLGYLDADSMSLYFANADTDDDQLLAVLENLFLLKIEPEGAWEWGKFRRLLIKRLSELEHIFIGLELHVGPAQPTVALKPSYTFDTIEFVVDQDRLASVGVDSTIFSDAATQKLSRYDGNSIQDLSNIGVVIDKQYLPLSVFSSFEARSTEVEVPSGLTARWVSERPEPTRPPEGLIIYIDENRLSMFLIELSVIDDAVRKHLTSNPTLTDIDALANIPIVQSSDGQTLRLGDIADIKQSYTNAKKQEGIDIPYEIRIR